MNSDRIHRLAGVAGLVGALLFFAGDMLFYGYIGSGSSFAAGMLLTVRHASVERLFVGGLLGPPAACLCLVGFWHVYRNVRPEAVVAGRIMLVAFLMLMVAGSAVHALWTVKGLAIKYCSGDDLACSTLAAAIKSYWMLAFNLAAIPGYIGALLLAGLVVLGKTYYPRWTVLANPAALLLLSPLANSIPSPTGAILVGGSANLSIAAFFLVSILTTWRRVTVPGDVPLGQPIAPLPSAGPRRIRAKTARHARSRYRNWQV